MLKGVIIVGVNEARGEIPSLRVGLWLVAFFILVGLQIGWLLIHGEDKFVRGVPFPGDK
jgi:hypothetical protein